MSKRAACAGVQVEVTARPEMRAAWMSEAVVLGAAAGHTLVHRVVGDGALAATTSPLRIRREAVVPKAHLLRTTGAVL